MLPERPPLTLLIAAPRGFCAGVNMAVTALETALKIFGAPLYVYHEIVHNKHIVERFRQRVGLPLATYFSGTKMRWMLDHVPGLRDGGILADVAPTALALLGQDQPDEMTGRNLIQGD